MATHSSILAWKIPWMEEPGGLKSMGHKELDTTNRLTHICNTVEFIFQDGITLGDHCIYYVYQRKCLCITLGYTFCKGLVVLHIFLNQENFWFLLIFQFTHNSHLLTLHLINTRLLESQIPWVIYHLLKHIALFKNTSQNFRESQITLHIHNFCQFYHTPNIASCFWDDIKWQLK